MPPADSSGTTKANIYMLSAYQSLYGQAAHHLVVYKKIPGTAPDPPPPLTPFAKLFLKRAAALSLSHTHTHTQSYDVIVTSRQE